MLTPSSIKSTFSNIISSAEADRNQFVHNPGKDMIRNRKCGFTDTIQITLGLESHSLNTYFVDYASKEDGYYQLHLNALHHVPLDTVPLTHCTPLQTRFSYSILKKKCNVYNGGVLWIRRIILTIFVE